MTSFIVENNSDGGDFKPVPPGLHLARCYRIVDLGTQQTEYMGEVKLQRKISIGWELHGCDDQGNDMVTPKGDPLAIFKNYTLSWNEKANLRIDLQNWRNKPFNEEEMRRFDISSVLDKWCMLNVIHRPGKNDKMYSNVSSISPVPAFIKNAGLPSPVNAVQLFRLADPDMALLETFGKGLKEKIMASPEWRAIQNKSGSPKAAPAPSEGSGFDDMDDDLPF
jgi:hypothetical protein